MSRPMSAIAIILIGVFFLCIIPAASAENSTYIPLGYTFPRVHTNITVCLDKLELSDFRMGNVYTSTPLDRVQWVRLWYHYENYGTVTEGGYLTVKLIDSIGNEYDEPDGSYTGENTAPQTRSIEKFLEFPVPKDVKITQIKSIQNPNEQLYDVPEASTVTPTAEATSVPTATPTPTPTPTAGSCLPFLPFALLSAIGLAGITAVRLQKKS